MSFRFPSRFAAVCIVCALSVSPALAIGVIIVTISPTNVTGGTMATGTVTLNGAAPATGYPVMLASANPAAAVPATITVLSGKTTATFNIATFPVVNDTYVFISASAPGSTTRQAQIAIRYPRLISLVAPTVMSGGSSVTGTFKLSGKTALPGVVELLANKPLNVPPYFRMFKGQDTFSFMIRADSVQGQQNAVVSVHAGATTLSQQITIKP